MSPFPDADQTLKINEVCPAIYRAFPQSETLFVTLVHRDNPRYHIAVRGEEDEGILRIRISDVAIPAEPDATLKTLWNYFAREFDASERQRADFAKDEEDLVGEEANCSLLLIVDHRFGSEWSVNEMWFQPFNLWP